MDDPILWSSQASGSSFLGRNNEAVKIGDLEKNSEAVKVQAQVRQRVLPNAVIREGVGALTLREGEEGTQRSFTNTAKVETGRQGPPLVDEDSHTVCQAIYKGVEGAAWETLCCKFVDINKAVNVRHPSGNSRVKTLWTARDAKERGDAYCDQTSDQSIVNRDAVRQELWNERPKHPALALDEALRRVAVWDDAGSSTSGGSRS